MPASRPRWWHWAALWLVAIGILLLVFLSPKAKNNDALRQQFDIREVGVAAVVKGPCVGRRYGPLLVIRRSDSRTVNGSAGLV
jgi:hypothetical protein